LDYLVTGGAGVIGSHLADALLAKGHRVTVLDNLSTGRRENLRDALDNDRFRLVIGDIVEEALVRELAAEADAIFHLAAAVGVDLVVQDPVRTIQTNVHGSESVFRAASRYQCRLLLASTSEVYGRADKQRFHEADDLLIGPPTHYRWAYAASKALDEFLALAYYKEGKLSPVIVRLFNTVGPRQTGRYGMVLPRFVEAALRQEPLRVFGDGTQTRCFCHVADTVRALVALMDNREATGRIFNVGTDVPISIRDLARKTIELAESSSGIEFVPYDEAYGPGFEDMQHRMPDTAALRELTGWIPRNNLDQIICEVRNSVAG
jgi:UDP-glucose 4-epimerase